MAVRSVVAQTIDTAGQEAQKGSKTSYPLIKRAVYYGSRLISAQKNTVFVNSHYEKIRKVYSIWIQMNAGKEKANTITEYSISEKNIVGAVKEKKSSYDLMTVIMVGLGDAQTADRPILRLLDILLFRANFWGDLAKYALTDCGFLCYHMVCDYRQAFPALCVFVCSSGMVCVRSSVG